MIAILKRPLPSAIVATVGIVGTTIGLLSRIKEAAPIPCTLSPVLSLYEHIVTLPQRTFSDGAPVPSGFATAPLTFFLQALAFALFVISNASAAEGSVSLLGPVARCLRLPEHTPKSSDVIEARPALGALLLLTTIYVLVFFLPSLLDDGLMRWLIIYGILTAWIAYGGFVLDVPGLRGLARALSFPIALTALLFFASAMLFLFADFIDELISLFPSQTLLSWRLAFWTSVQPFLLAGLSVLAVCTAIAVGTAYGHTLFLLRAGLCLLLAFAAVAAGYVLPCARP